MYFVCYSANYVLFMIICTSLFIMYFSHVCSLLIIDHLCFYYNLAHCSLYVAHICYSLAYGSLGVVHVS